MYDDIPLMRSDMKIVYDALKKSDLYNAAVKNTGLSGIESMSYRIEDSVKYLLAHHTTQSWKEDFMYLQSFSYTKSGVNYYTRRSNYQSVLLLYTHSGQGELEYEGRNYHLSQNDGFLIDCRKEHKYYTKGTHWEHSDLHFWGKNCSYLYNALFADTTPFFHISNLENQLETILREYVSENKARDIKTSSYLNDIMLLIYNALVSVDKTDIMIQLQSYIEQNFERQLTIDMLADHIGLSKYHLIRSFRKTTGFAPHEYINYLRISKAEELLRNSELPSWKIGIVCGFTAESNFIAQFKKKHGITPGKFRQLYGSR